MEPSRRELLGAAGAAGLTAGAPPDADELGAGWLQSVLERYADFGPKASGGAGDNACGAWLGAELGRAGYACTRQAFDAPFFEADRTMLASGDARAEVIPQALIVPTGPDGLSAPLRRTDCGGDLSGAIALIVLPCKRWIALADPEAAEPLADAFRRGAAAAVLVTTGPTGEAIALNVSSRHPGFGKPVVVLAPKDAPPFLQAAQEGRSSRLIVAGRGGAWPAFNLIARLDRKAARTLILSTPRSGWFTCAAERGSGLAAWLSLGLWLARADHRVNLELVATSGHEYDFAGGARYLAEQAPRPEATQLWVHIGASAAARDWHELFAAGLRPLPSADAQRVLAATPDLIAPARRAFAGITGLEATYLADKASAGGELTNVLAAGYRSAIGLYGVHRYFHTKADDLRCTSAELVRPVAAAFRTLLTQALATPRA